MMQSQSPGPRQVRRFVVDEFKRMGAAGVFADDECFELVAGELLTMPPPGPRHSSVVAALARLLLERAGKAAVVWIQNPIQLDQHNLFLPDLALLRHDRDGYRNRYPGPADIRLVLEVAESTLDGDLARKLPVYAGAGIGDVWLLDLRGDQVQAFAEPATDGYGAIRRCRGGDRLRLPDDGEVTVRELLQLPAA